MTLVARELSVPALPLELAKRLSDRPGLALLWDASGEHPSFVASDPVEQIEAFDPEPELPLSKLDEPFRSVPRWIGVLPYEAARGIERRAGVSADGRPAPLVERPLWWRYDAVAVVTERVIVVGTSQRALDHLSARLVAQAPAPSLVRAAERVVFEPEIHHLRRIERALQHIAAGDIYQVNLARRFEFSLEGRLVDALSLLGASGTAPHAAVLSNDAVEFMSLSPELFLELRPNRLVMTAPIKGTRPRGADAASDHAAREELDTDPKERAELAMILDVERNDLGKVCEFGSIRVLEGPKVQTFPTLHHRMATIAGRLRGACSRSELLAAMLPSGSVTGAPKIRAMELIFELEPERRGLYTGAFGALTHAGGLRLGMAIRVVTRRPGTTLAHYFAGGGIVSDSHPERELSETGWKSLAVRALVGDVRTRARHRGP